MIMDNLPAHKIAGVRQAIEATGAGLLYLPPYSPNFNPIEMASPNSKPGSVRPPPEPSKISGPPSPISLTPSPRKNASTTSPQLDMIWINLILL